MAKKDEEKVMTVEEKLRALYELQTVDSKIDELRILAGELPQEVKDMSDEVEGLKTRLTNIENSIKECETGISDFRVRIENANASISRYKEQQNNVRNNREYDNLTKEIEYQELDSCGGCHSKIPAQRQLDIRLRKKIIVCEFCGRILVDTEIDAKKK